MGEESPSPCDRAGTSAAGPENFVGHRMRVCTVVRVSQVKNNQKREKACAVEGWALAMAGADAHLNLDLPHTLGHLRMEFTIPPQQVRDNHLLPLPTIMVASFWVSHLTLPALRHLTPTLVLYQYHNNNLPVSSLLRDRRLRLRHFRFRRLCWTPIWPCVLPAV